MADVKPAKVREQKERRDYYRVGGRFGAGTFGVLFMGSTNHGREVALKVERPNPHVNYLANEARVYRALEGVEGIARLTWYGRTTDDQSRLLKTIGLEVLGPNMFAMLKICGGKFSLKTVLLLADQFISRMEDIHGRRYIHRDVKPDNMAMGLGANSSTAYVLDFGMAKTYVNPEGDYMVNKISRGLCGTARYASLNVHRGNEPDRRDDMISLGYTLVHFLRGTLPWKGVSRENEMRETYHKRIFELKSRLTVDEVCAGAPEEFKTYLLHCGVLKFGQRPDYWFLRQLFRKLAARMNYEYDGVFDWNEWTFPDGAEEKEESSGPSACVSKNGKLGP